MARQRRRDSGEGSVYKVVRRYTRTDGTVKETVSYRGFVTIRTAGGKQERKYASAPSKTECAKKIRDLQTERDAGTLTSTTSPTLEAWVNHYLTELAPKKRIKGKVGNTRSTISAYKGYARTWFFPRVGKVKLDALTVEHLEEVYDAMAKAGLTTTSIERHHAMIRTILAMAVKRGKVARNVATIALLPVGAESRVVRDVAAGEPKRVLQAALSRRGGVRWVLRLCYGLRQGENLGLSWADIDFEAQNIHINRQLQRDRAEHGCGKPTKAAVKPRDEKVEHGCGDPIGESMLGSQGRPLLKPRIMYPCGHWQASRCPSVVRETDGEEREVWPCGKHQAARCPEASGGGLVLNPVKTRASQAPLPLPQPIADLLIEWRRQQKRERLQEGPRWKGWEVPTRVGAEQADLVVTQRNGRPIDPRDDWDDWQALLVAAGVEPIHPHAARGWAATMLVELGVHPRVAMEMLRHTDITTTLNIYAKAPSEDLRAAADAIAVSLLGKPKAAGE